MAALPSDNLTEHKRALLTLRAISDPECRLRSIVSYVERHTDGSPAVIALAVAEANLLKDRGAGITLGYVLMRLRKLAEPELPAPAIVAQFSESSTQAKSPFSVLVDPNELRIIRALYGNAWIVLAVARHLTRSAKGSGKVKRADVLKYLADAGIKTHQKTIYDRWIKPYVGILWGYDRHEKALYPYAPTRHTKQGLLGKLNITQHAIDARRVDLLGTGDTDLPGQRMISLRLGSTPKACAGELVKAWHNTRKNPHASIGRATLCTLFGVTEKTLQAWEKVAGITPERVFADFADGDEHLNAQRAKRAIPILVNNVTSIQLRWRVQWSNRYNVPELEARAHRRNPRERRRAAVLTLERFLTRNTPNTSEAGTGAGCIGARVGSSKRTKINYYNRRTSKAFVTAHKQVYQAVKKQQDYQHPYAAELGYDNWYRSQVVEITTSEAPQTAIGRQLPRKDADEWFTKHGGRGTVRLHLQERAQWL